MLQKHAVTAAVLAVAAAGPLDAQDRASVIAVTTNEYAFTEAPDTVTLRDRFERVVYQAPGRLSCQG